MNIQIERAIGELQLVLALDNTGDYDLSHKDHAAVVEIIHRLKLYCENAKANDNDLDTGSDSVASTLDKQV